MKLKRLLPIALFSAMMLTACGGTTPSTSTSGGEHGVAITNKEAITAEGFYDTMTRELEIELTPEGNVMLEMTNGNLEVTTSDATVVSVSGIVLTAMKEGTATVTVKYYDAIDTVTVTTHGQKPETPAITVAEALELKDDEEVVVRGIVSKIDQKWNSSYGNMCCSITDDTGTLYVYRTKTQVELGDDITVTGKMATYNGARQVAQGSTAVIHSSGNDIPGYVAPKEVSLEEALAAEDGTYVIVNGIVNKIAGEWSESYGNMNVYITDGKVELYVYRLETKVELGDDITVTGYIGSYNGKKQIAQGSSAVINSSGNTIPELPTEEPTPGTLVLDFGTKTYENTVATADQLVIKEQGVTITVNKAGSTTDLVAPTDLIKVYKNATCTIALDDGAYTKIEIFTSGGKYAFTGNETNTGGTVTATGVTFTEPTSSWMFTADQNQVRLTKLVITLAA